MLGDMDFVVPLIYKPNDWALCVPQPETEHATLVWSGRCSNQLSYLARTG